MTTTFTALSDGFRFGNHFEDLTQIIPWRGACGGMCYAALDYFHAGIRMPSHRPGDFHGLLCPSNASKLGSYIWARQTNSLLGSWHGSKHLALWMNPDDNALAHWSANDEWTILKQWIDAHVPMPLGLVSFGDLFAHHQVVAYGYEEGPGKKTIHVYDPNVPCVEVTLTQSGRYWRASHNGSNDPDPAKNGHWRGFFVETGYEKVRPSYRDIVLWQQPSVDSPVEVPTPATGHFEIRNRGEYAAHVAELTLAEPDGKGGLRALFPQVSDLDVPVGSGTQYFEDLKSGGLEGRAFAVFAAYTSWPGEEWDRAYDQDGNSDAAFFSVTAQPAETILTIEPQQGVSIVEAVRGKEVSSVLGGVVLPLGRPAGIDEIDGTIRTYEVKEWNLRAVARATDTGKPELAPPLAFEWSLDGGPLPADAAVSPGKQSSRLSITLAPRAAPYVLAVRATDKNGKVKSTSKTLTLGGTVTDMSGLWSALERVSRILRGSDVVLGLSPVPPPGPIPRPMPNRRPR